MTWTNWDFREISKAGFAAIFIILGASLLEYSRDTTSFWTIGIAANALIGLGVTIGFLTSKNLKDGQHKLEYRVDQLEKFFGIKLENIGLQNSSNIQPKRVRDIHFWASLVTIITLPVIVGGLVLSISEVKSGEKSVDALTTMVGNSNQTLGSLKKTITAISHQAVLESFAIERKHTMGAHTCGNIDTLNPKDHSTIIYQNYTVSPKIITESGEESVVPYYADFDFLVDFSNSTTKKNEKVLPFYHRLPFFPIDPENPKSFSLNITDATSVAKQYDADTVRIDLNYGFSPYSSAKDVTLVEYNNSRTIQPLIEYSFTPQEGWKAGDGEGICKR